MFGLKTQSTSSNSNGAKNFIAGISDYCKKMKNYDLINVEIEVKNPNEIVLKIPLRIKNAN